VFYGTGRGYLSTPYLGCLVNPSTVPHLHTVPVPNIIVWVNYSTYIYMYGILTYLLFQTIFWAEWRIRPLPPHRRTPKRQVPVPVFGSSGNIPLNLNFCRCIRCRKSGQNVEAGEHFKVSHSFKNLIKAGGRGRTRITDNDLFSVLPSNHVQ